MKLFKGADMRRYVIAAGVLGSFLFMGSMDCHAKQWVKEGVQANKVVEAVYYDAKSIKLHGKKTVFWTEKYVLTKGSSAFNTKHLSEYPACKKSIDKKGDVTYSQMDFEMISGKYRNVAIRNYNKSNELLCTDKDMGTEMDSTWQETKRGTPMYDMYYIFVTKYKMGNILE